MEYVKCVCVCVWLGAAWVHEWMRGLGLGITNPVGTWECWTCVCDLVAVVVVVLVGCGKGVWTRVCRGGVALYMCEL